MKKEYEEWFEIAESDLNFAKVGLKEGFYPQVCFISQQVIEKALKGYLVTKSRHFPKTHSLIDLYHLCKAKWLEPFKQKIKLIDEYYVPMRYPGGFPGSLGIRQINEKDAKEALTCAEDVLQAVYTSVVRT